LEYTSLIHKIYYNKGKTSKDIDKIKYPDPALLLLLQDLANTAAQKPLNVEFSTVKFTIFPQSLPKSATSFLMSSRRNS